MVTNFIIYMAGYTGVGKSVLAKNLAKKLKVKIFHSAMIRKDLSLTPKKKNVDEFFDFRNKMRREIDKIVYGKMVERAENVLRGGGSVILDAGHFFKWQRDNIYKMAYPMGVEIFAIRVICRDENEIKRRLNKRLEMFDSSPLNETPSWKTYISTKIVTEPLESDSLPNGESPNIIEYDTVSGEVKILHKSLKSKNMEKILNAINENEISFFVQDRNFRFVESSVEEFMGNKNLKSNFVVAIDFDGVITSPHELKTKYINEFGYEIKEEHSGYNHCIRKAGIKEEHYKKGLEKAFLENPKTLPLEKDFKKFFEKIRNLNCVIVIVTSRYRNMIKHLEEYLKNHKIKVDCIINTQSVNKSESLKMINANFFVDDSLFKINLILNKHLDDNFIKKCKFVLFRNIANKIEKNNNPNLEEVDSWEGIYKILLKSITIWR